ncbi:MAG TPA: hypothetical protein PL073_01435 [Spirochaetota bacterium]|nr:hypothetical protein [Spirochaetota bacterium]
MSLKTAGVLSIVTGVGILLFWIAFFTVGLAPDIPPACYFSYEYAFPLPDTILSLALIIGGIYALQRHAMKIVLLPACGGLIFLGLLDMAFNYQNGMYTITVMDGVLNAFINIWCVVFGLCAILTLQREYVKKS